MPWLHELVSSELALATLYRVTIIRLTSDVRWRLIEPLRSHERRARWLLGRLKQVTGIHSLSVAPFPEWSEPAPRLDDRGALSVLAEAEQARTDAYQRAFSGGMLGVDGLYEQLLSEHQIRAHRPVGRLNQPDSLAIGRGRAHAGLHQLGVVVVTDRDALGLRHIPVEEPAAPAHVAVQRPDLAQDEVGAAVVALVRDRQRAGARAPGPAARLDHEALARDAAHQDVMAAAGARRKLGCAVGAEAGSTLGRRPAS